MLEQVRLPSNHQDHTLRTVVLRPDLAPDAVPHQLRLYYLDIPLGDPQVGLAQRHLGIPDRSREKWPLPVHMLKEVESEFGAPLLECRAESVPPGQDHPRLRPGENPGDRAQILDP